MKSWIKGGRKKDSLDVVGEEDPQRNYTVGSHYDFYISPKTLFWIKTFSMINKSLDWWSDFLGGPSGEDVNSLDKIDFLVKNYALGKFIVIIGKGASAFKKEMKVPEGFKQVKGAKGKFGAPVFRKGNVYISPDKTTHNTIGWKVAKGKPENLLMKETREGTFNESLTKKIGD